ncbi:hypothetical protein [Ornithobacterium rhinotracheale]
MTDDRKIEPVYEVCEDVSDEIFIKELGRRSILTFSQHLISKIVEHDNSNIYYKFKELEG